jgi:hypothetical protein
MPTEIHQCLLKLWILTHDKMLLNANGEFKYHANFKYRNNLSTKND